MNTNKLYHGYLALPRQAILLRQFLGLNLFSLYISLVMVAIWHRGNQRVGCVVGTQKEISNHLGVNQSTVSRALVKLISKDKKLVIIYPRYVKLGYFPLFLKDVAAKMHSKDYADLHRLYADMHRINADLQEKYADLHSKGVQKNAQSFYSSSKDNLSSLGGEISDEVIEEFDKTLT